MAFVYVKPYIDIAGTDYVCLAEKVTLTVEDMMADSSTFCTPELEVPADASVSIWTCTIEWKQDYEAAGPWNVLNTIATATPRVASAITLRPATGTIGVTNPEANFTGWIPSPPFMDAAPGKSMIFTSEFQTVGVPVFTTA